MGEHNYNVKNFVSPNHIFYHENVNGLYLPNYVGRSSLERWIFENKGNVDIISNGVFIKEISGKLSDSMVIYYFNLGYKNHRPLRDTSQDKINQSIMRGSTWLCDEFLELKWKRKKEPSEKILKAIIGHGFRETRV